MSIKQLIIDLEQEVQNDNVNKQVEGDLALYTYSPLCNYRGAWNETTKQARGLIIDLKNERVVARPFRKFFNMGETIETHYNYLPTGEVEITTKMDGSLGTIFYYAGQWRVATKGSFKSDQAVWATNRLNSGRYNLDWLVPSFTYLCEIIYPDNKVVVDYRGLEDLTMLAIVDTENGYEYPRTDVNFADLEEAGFNLVEMHHGKTIDELLRLKEVLDHHNEGWVVRFLKNNMRVKIKTDAYVKVHRIISECTPLGIWRALEDGRVKEEIVVNIPKEIRPDFNRIKDALEKQYNDILKRAKDIANEITPKGWDSTNPTKEGMKSVALQLQSYSDSDTIKSCVFALVKNKTDSIDQTIMQAIRPNENNMDRGEDV